MASYNVLLVCAAGMSSSLLENRARDAARAQGHEMTIHALSVGEIACYDLSAKPVDMILVAPQVRYKKKSIAEMASKQGIIVQDIEPTVFGMVDGEKLFAQIKQAVARE